MSIENAYDSEYCNVKYIPNDNKVLLTWKKFCCFDDYRNPTLFALDLLKNHQNSDFVVDARNGFEDVKEDLEWGFSVLLPAISNTDCSNVTFIMTEINEIEEEIKFDIDKHLQRRPQNREDMPLVGIFSQRGKDRPNQIGITSVQIVSITSDTLIVKGLDAIDRTPILDIKPYFPMYDCKTDAIMPEWVDRLMEHYF